MDDHIQFGM
jgi:ABC-type phosphate transport system ATPase subunit